jgi:hypothetical protein
MDRWQTERRRAEIRSIPNRTCLRWLRQATVPQRRWENGARGDRITASAVLAGISPFGVGEAKVWLGSVASNSDIEMNSDEWGNEEDELEQGQGWGVDCDEVAWSHVYAEFVLGREESLEFEK